MNRDIIVIGGGLVGSAIAHGLSRHTRSIVVLDEGDRAFRATRGNFGLVWVQSKGDGAPHYVTWSRRSADLWGDFAAELRDETGVDAFHRRTGGIHLLLSDEEFAQRTSLMERLRRQSGNEGYEYKMLSRDDVRDMIPTVGPDVVGGSWTPYDGVANPLFALRAIHASLGARGVAYRPGMAVEAISHDGGTFTVRAGGEVFRSKKLVIAAGLGTKHLAAKLGMRVPVEPQRGQVLVTERLKPLLGTGVTVTNVRQTAEGSVMIGDSQEDVGFDNRTSVPVLAEMAARAVQKFPALRDAQIVRTWAALRVMSADGLPIYVQSREFPGAYAATCHSGVTLAAAHSRVLAEWIAGGPRPEETLKLVPERFDVPQAAE
ncbi:MAG: NAD(P)/FAD-dependent oxidoreductase [Alphaproteobacteria bacterium]